VDCDFFTVETIWLKTPYVLFFIQLSTRRVVVAGVAATPDSAWVTQHARNAAMNLDDQQLPARFLLRDHDAKFTRPFDDVFQSGDRGDPNPDPGAEGERLCRAVGADRAGGVSGLDARAR
jgi:hypothetical protein